MKQFLLFAGDQYYPSGGWGDFKGSFDTIAEARAAERALPGHDWWQIIDVKTGNVIDGTDAGW